MTIAMLQKNNTISEMLRLACYSRDVMDNTFMNSRNFGNFVGLPVSPTDSTENFIFKES